MRLSLVTSICRRAARTRRQVEAGGREADGLGIRVVVCVLPEDQGVGTPHLDAAAQVDVAVWPQRQLLRRDLAVAIPDFDVAERGFGNGHAADTRRDDLERVAVGCVGVAFGGRRRQLERRLGNQAELLREGLRRHGKDEPERDDRSAACEGHEVRLN
jgi:hypothetical protein